jgi:hypothetical protein
VGELPAARTASEAPPKPKAPAVNETSPQADAKPEKTVAEPAADQRIARVQETPARPEETEATRDEETGDDESDADAPGNDSKKNSFWSMEQLRKNLSNFVGREGEQTEETGE